MNTMVFIMDDDEAAIPEADAWQSGVVARTSDGAMGIGFVFKDSSGFPIMGARMTPGQALEQADYFFKVALQILRHTAPLKAEEVAQRILREAVELPRGDVAIQILREALAELESGERAEEVRHVPPVTH